MYFGGFALLDTYTRQMYVLFAEAYKVYTATAAATITSRAAVEKREINGLRK